MKEPYLSACVSLYVAAMILSALGLLVELVGWWP